MKRFEGFEQGPRSDPFIPPMLRYTHLVCGTVRKVPPQYRFLGSQIRSVRRRCDVFIFAARDECPLL